MKLLRNKNGSSVVILAMVFVTMMICITAAITISRALVVKSECESFGRVWTKAILSEYDRNLFEKYHILAYWGNESEVQKKIDTYLSYSANGKLDASIGRSASELMGYELGDPDNFRKALTDSCDLISNNKTERIGRTGETSEDRVIRNTAVLDTLPSGKIKDSLSVDEIAEKIKSFKTDASIHDVIAGTGVEMELIYNSMNNRVTISEGNDSYLRNEWEYILHGTFSDNNNSEYCEKILRLVRNALNLAYIYSDPEKVEVITFTAECLAPGTGLITQAIIAEAWAAAETEKDIDILFNNGRIPFIKKSENWNTGINEILDSNEIKSKLSEGDRKLLSDNYAEITEMKGAKGRENRVEGATYDDYLELMISLLPEKTRLLRIMDLIQINMKYLYYRDFNMMEYYTGVRFSIGANGRTYEFEDCYK